MIKRIIELKDIGRFESIKSSRGNEGEFAKVNVVYAPNACGKTTLCDVFRSLDTRNPAYVIGRKRIGSSTAPSIDFLSANNLHWKFNNGQWEFISDCPPIFIYDQRFVKENVLVGGQIGIEQKRNVYSLALGKRAIELNKAVQDAGDELTRATETVSQCASVLSALIPKGQQIETFRKIEKIDDVDAKIADVKERIVTDQNKKSKADQIRKHRLLHKIAIPEVSKDDLVGIGSATLDDAALTAEEKIKEHLAKCADIEKISITWIKQGYEAQTGNICPYCGQDMSHTDVLSSYKAFFSGALKQQENQRNKVLKDFQMALDEQALNELSNGIKQNSSDIDWWKDACGLLLVLPELNEEEIKASYSNALGAAQAAVERKLNSLTASILLQEDESAVINSINSIVLSFQAYNDAVEVANAKIMEFQKSIESINIDALKSKLADLELKKMRYEDNVVIAYQKYDEALDLKNRAQDAKTTANEALKQESKSIFETFGLKINEILKAFGVDFSVDNDGVNLRGGTATGQLGVKMIVNGSSLKVDCSSEAAEDPSRISLANTLSGGDCSALGLAFFLARLETDVDFASSIVVVDDPYHDQDRSRQAQTISMLKRKAIECSQFFLFTHNLEFAQMFMANKGIAREDIRAFEIPQLVSSVELKHGELPPASSKSYEVDYSELSDYVANPGQYQNRLKEVVGRIRPLLETYLHYKYPLSWGDKQWLGEMIKEIRESQPNDVIYPCSDLLQNLDDVNNYTQRFHHRVNGETADVPDPRELMIYVKKALEIVHHA
ncbi:AAA family ATPase [bacterium]|nr:AAA family ATPase [bacterium]